jgi:hypothetical protein
MNDPPRNCAHTRLLVYVFAVSYEVLRAMFPVK